MDMTKGVSILTTLILVTLAAPSFALAGSGNSVANTTQAAAASHYTPWDGGGSNAMSADAYALSGTAARNNSVAASQYTPWDGGGSNAMSADAYALSGTSVQDNAVAASQYTPWDGGGSNAMSEASNSRQNNLAQGKAAGVSRVWSSTGHNMAEAN